MKAPHRASDHKAWAAYIADAKTDADRRGRVELHYLESVACGMSSMRSVITSAMCQQEVINERARECQDALDAMAEDDA
jgi:hypothetical protein